MLEEFFAQGGTDYVAYLFAYGEAGRDRSQGTGIVYSFTTDRKRRLQRRRHEARAGDAAGALAGDEGARRLTSSPRDCSATYLGEDAGRRVHAGSIMRGSVDKLRAVMWYADIRGFTAISDDRRPVPWSSNCSMTSSKF